MSKVNVLRSKKLGHLHTVVAEHSNGFEVFVTSDWYEALEVARDWVRFTTPDAVHYKVQITTAKFRESD